MTSQPTSTTGSLSMVLPLPPNIANVGYSHWAPKHKAKVKYWDSLTAHMHARLIPSPPVNWPAKARVTMTFYLWGKQDRDNLYARTKWVCDWLAGKGYIAGDREDQIDLVVQQQTDRKHPRLKVEIEPVEAA